MILFLTVEVSQPKTAGIQGYEWTGRMATLVGFDGSAAIVYYENDGEFMRYTLPRIREWSHRHIELSEDLGDASFREAISAPNREALDESTDEAPASSEGLQ